MGSYDMRDDMVRESLQIGIGVGVLLLDNVAGHRTGFYRRLEGSLIFGCGNDHVNAFEALCNGAKK